MRVTRVVGRHSSTPKILLPDNIHAAIVETEDGWLIRLVDISVDEWWLEISLEKSLEEQDE